MIFQDTEGTAGAPYPRTGLSADPLYRYIRLTRRGTQGVAGEVAEEDIIGTSWIQRLRRIHQLQTAWWVFPTAEHSRYPHSVGAMHLAGEWGKLLYPTLKSVCPEVPSLNLVEETLRMAGLLHDVGHGPFSHFFDYSYSCRWGVDHEAVGRAIILERLAPMISELRASPTGDFEPGEQIDPRWVAFLICESPLEGFAPPRWLELLQPLLTGPFSADNMDYVPRDAYACGINPGNVDVDRILHYTFMSPDGLAVHTHGEAAVFGFLSARLFLYQQVYYHRTVRRIDLQLREIFGPTIDVIFGGLNPLEALDAFQELTEWTLLGEVDRWARRGETPELRELGRAWRQIFDRQLKWELVYSGYAETREHEAEMSGMSSHDFAAAVRDQLPAGLRGIEFEVDVAAKESRATNPMTGPPSIIFYDPLLKRYSSSQVHELFRRLPQSFALFRIYARDLSQQAELIEAAERVLGRGDRD